MIGTNALWSLSVSVSWFSNLTSNTSWRIYWKDRYIIIAFCNVQPDVKNNIYYNLTTGHYYELILWSLNLLICYGYNYKIQICIIGAYMQTSTIIEPHARTPITMDNWTLLFAQLTDSWRTSNSLMLKLLYQLCAIISLSLLMVNNLSWQHVDVPSATVHLIGWFVNVNFRLFWHHTS